MAAKPEVFQVSFSLERQHVRHVLRAVLGTILFQRVLGTLRPRSLEVCGVTFPVPSDDTLEALIAEKVDAFAQAILSNPTPATAGSPAKPNRLVLALYPTPLVPRQLPPKPRPGPTVASALGWFSASAKALASGGAEEESHDGEVDEEDGECGPVWEAWVVDCVVEGAEGRGGFAGEERIRRQLNEFLLRTVMFVNEKNSHVPPITSAELQPFGVQILINPTALPFVIPKHVIQAPNAFPLLYKSIVTPTVGRSAVAMSGGREGSGESYSTRA